jgi:hypothetical protein
MSVVGALYPKENRLSIVIQIGFAVRGLQLSVLGGWKPQLRMQSPPARTNES